MVNGHKSVAYSDSPDGATGEMCLGRGMQCPTASSLWSPYVIGRPYIFSCCGLFFFFFLLFFFLA